ncbi:hypothetical protein D3C80_2168840 [compost metagenome]
METNGTTNVISMDVCVENGLQMNTESLNLLNISFDLLVDRIDNDGLSGAWACNQVSIGGALWVKQLTEEEFACRCDA